MSNECDKSEVMLMKVTSIELQMYVLVNVIIKHGCFKTDIFLIDCDYRTTVLFIYRIFEMTIIILTTNTGLSHVVDQL